MSEKKETATELSAQKRETFASPGLSDKVNQKQLKNNVAQSSNIFELQYEALNIEEAESDYGQVKEDASDQNE